MRRNNAFVTTRSLSMVRRFFTACSGFNFGKRRQAPNTRKKIPSIFLDCSGGFYEKTDAVLKPASVRGGLKQVSLFQ
jgi:hypothetical protein